MQFNTVWLGMAWLGMAWVQWNQIKLSMLLFSLFSSHFFSKVLSFFSCRVSARTRSHTHKLSLMYWFHLSISLARSILYLRFVYIQSANLGVMGEEGWRMKREREERLWKIVYWLAKSNKTQQQQQHQQQQQPLHEKYTLKIKQTSKWKW